MHDMLMPGENQTKLDQSGGRKHMGVEDEFFISGVWAISAGKYSSWHPCSVPGVRESVVVVCGSSTDTNQRPVFRITFLNLQQMMNPTPYIRTIMPRAIYLWYYSA